MNRVSSVSAPTILCVACDPHDLPNGVREVLADVNLRYETVNDAYRAIARIAKAPPQVVFVCTDWLGAESAEFFPLVRRRNPQLAVLVWGRRGVDDRVDRAIELGATGVLSPETVRQVAPSARFAAPARHTTSTFASTNNVLDAQDRPRQVGDTTGGDHHKAVPPGIDDVETPPGGTDKELDSGADYRQARNDDAQLPDAPGLNNDDSAPKPVRVPWLRYNDGPTRLPPKRVPPTRQPVEPDDDPPLLTDEELEALFNDGPT